MGAVYFYHLAARPLEATLTMLIERARAAGWRICVRGSNPRRMDWLDEALWLTGDGFLPHALAGTEFEADQPVLLTTATGMPNAATCLMTMDGADLTPDEVRRLDRVCIVFDGADPAALGKARSQWQQLTAAGCSAQYWSQESGRWEKRAET